MSPPEQNAPTVYPPQVFDCRSLFVGKGDEWGFPKGASVLITGVPGAGKSFMALALGRGMLFPAKKKMAAGGPPHVMYLVSAELDRDRIERNFSVTGWFDKTNNDPLFVRWQI